MAAPSYTYTLTNGSTADASQVTQNFNDILNGVTDGTKDLTINALTCNGAVSFKGTVALGDAAADDITVTGSLASSIPIKTTNTYDIGSATKGLAGAYFGANSQTVRIIGSSSMSATWTLTLPVSAGSANQLLITNGSGVTSWTGITNAAFNADASNSGTVNTSAQTFAGVKTFQTGVLITGRTSSPGTGNVGEYLQAVNTAGASSPASADTWTDADTTNLSLSLTAGVWLVGYGATASSDAAGGGGSLRLNLATDGAVNGTTAYVQPTTSGASTYGYSRQAVIAITGSQTIRLQYRRASSGTCVIASQSLTAGMADPDNQNIVWAVRVA